jgi:phosphopantetheinyl transferase (holo-ACP synthase)
MVGNDVIDLLETRRRRRHPRFDGRVFTAGERRAIAAADDPEQWRWATWAAKESAYKIARRADPAAVFSPIRFVVELDQALCGQVRHAGRHYPVRITRRDDCIHAVATASGRTPAAMLAGVGPLPCDVGDDTRGRALSRAARALAIREIAPHLGAGVDELVVRQRSRIPLLQHRDGRDAATLSLSHHGRFVAYACALPDADREARG